MTKKLALFIFCSILFVQGLKSQIDKKKIRVTASDSTVFNLDFVEYEGDDTYKNFIFVGLGGNDLGSLLQAGYTRYAPEKFIATGEVGAFPTASEFNASGIYFMLHTKNECRLKYHFMSIASNKEDEYTINKKYIMKTNGIRNIHIGIHGQAGYRNMNLSYYPTIMIGDSVYTMLRYSSARIAAGIGVMATRNGLLYIGNNKDYTGTGSMLMAFIDGIYYPGQRISYTKQVDPYLTDADASGLAAEDVTNGLVGFEIRLVGQHQFHFQKSKIPGANFGFRWQAGLMTMNYTGPYSIPTFGKFVATSSFGVYASFGQ